MRQEPLSPHLSMAWGRAEEGGEWASPVGHGQTHSRESDVSLPVKALPLGLPPQLHGQQAGFWAMCGPA